jgi:hypothetical protein
LVVALFDEDGHFEPPRQRNKKRKKRNSQCFIEYLKTWFEIKVWQKTEEH